VGFDLTTSVVISTDLSEMELIYNIVSLFTNFKPKRQTYLEKA